MTVIEDDLDEPNEVFSFELSSPVNAQLESGIALPRVFILNDD